MPDRADGLGPQDGRAPPAAGEGESDGSAEGLGPQDRRAPPAAGKGESRARAEGLGPQARRAPPAAAIEEDGWEVTEGIPKVLWDR